MRKMWTGVAFIAAFSFACFQAVRMDAGEMGEAPGTGDTTAAVFAGGCFWCTEADFEKLEGVIEAVSGYTGGRVENPSYKAVSGGGTGHVEAVKVIYDPERIHYRQLLHYF